MTELYKLPELPYLRTRFTLEACQDCRLPPHKGSLLRGALGHALRRAVCLVGPQVECGGCGFRQTCAYARLYELLPSDDERGFVEGRPAAPRPYVFEALDERCDFRAGERFDFDLLLFGEAARWQAHVGLAIEAMASQGLGARRHPFRRVAGSYQDASLAWHELADPRSSQGELAPTVVAKPSPRSAERAVLRFVTPTRVIQNGQLKKDFSLRTVLWSGLRRVLELAHFHASPGHLDWNLEPLLDLSDHVAVVSRDTRWLDLPRYSNRQRSRMTLGGIVGEWTLEGPLTALSPALQLAEIVHVGKAATFGLGKIEMVW